MPPRESEHRVKRELPLPDVFLATGSEFGVKSTLYIYFNTDGITTFGFPLAPSDIMKSVFYWLQKTEIIRPK